MLTTLGGTLLVRSACGVVRGLNYEREKRIRYARALDCLECARWRHKARTVLRRLAEVSHEARDVERRRRVQLSAISRLIAMASGRRLLERWKGVVARQMAWEADRRAGFAAAIGAIDMSKPHRPLSDPGRLRPSESLPSLHGPPPPQPWLRVCDASTRLGQPLDLPPLVEPALTRICREVYAPVREDGRAADPRYIGWKLVAQLGGPWSRLGWWIRYKLSLAPPTPPPPLGHPPNPLLCAETFRVDHPGQPQQRSGRRLGIVIKEVPVPEAESPVPPPEAAHALLYVLAEDFSDENLLWEAGYWERQRAAIRRQVGALTPGTPVLIVLPDHIGKRKRYEDYEPQQLVQEKLQMGETGRGFQEAEGLDLPQDDGLPRGPLETAFDWAVVNLAFEAPQLPDPEAMERNVRALAEGMAWLASHYRPPPLIQRVDLRTMVASFVRKRLWHDQKDKDTTMMSPDLCLTLVNDAITAVRDELCGEDVTAIVWPPTELAEPVATPRSHGVEMAVPGALFLDVSSSGHGALAVDWNAPERVMATEALLDALRLPDLGRAAAWDPAKHQPYDWVATYLQVLWMACGVWIQSCGAEGGPWHGL
jgi:hypothetical protein